MNRCKCKFPDGVIIKPDGVNELDPCLYRTVARYVNVTVEIRKCERCGNVDVAWVRQDDTEVEGVDDDGC